MAVAIDCKPRLAIGGHGAIGASSTYRNPIHASEQAIEIEVPAGLSEIVEGKIGRWHDSHLRNNVACDQQQTQSGERVRVAGALESFNLSTEEAEALILRARVAAGWIEASDIEQPAEAEAEGEFEEEPAEA